MHFSAAEARWGYLYWMCAKLVISADGDQADRGASNPAERAAPSVPDERDAAIAQLERALADGVEQIATLRESLEQSRFRAEILEKGYSTQLADARKRSAAAEQALADQQAHTAELDAAREEMTKQLAEMREQLERVARDRDRLLERLEPADGTERAAPGRAGSRRQEAQSIDELLASLDAPPERPLGADEALRPAQARAEQDTPPEEMLSPELVFLRGKNR
jgi:chromosome segregation ATPase